MRYKNLTDTLAEYNEVFRDVEKADGPPTVRDESVAYDLLGYVKDARGRVMQISTGILLGDRVFAVTDLRRSGYELSFTLQEAKERICDK